MKNVPIIILLKLFIYTFHHRAFDFLIIQKILDIKNFNIK